MKISMTLPRLPIEMVTIALRNGAIMEEIIVLHTYTMKNLYISLPFRIHQLLIYILSFFTIPTRLNADIDLTKYLEKTGLTMRTVANYSSNIGQIHEETASGTILPLLKHHRINYEQQSLECELNEQWKTDE